MASVRRHTRGHGTRDYGGTVALHASAEERLRLEAATARRCLGPGDPSGDIVLERVGTSF
jgi:hypothetical protein